MNERRVSQLFRVACTVGLRVVNLHYHKCREGIGEGSQSCINIFDALKRKKY